ncbi:hypothetical protein TEA_008316 [Camellia sinensis var. sinensis]|uniref:Uncharacterized protein n=1 Tax=Camellia sinensis var. sinensis TaxID=542762 RepID=A0A4S4ET97_CAMSN|nr:hypothetical protein TEA_008316 [Camellia sinensis var. sinensis]
MKLQQYSSSSILQEGFSSSGVRIKPLSVRYGLGISDHDSEGRLVTVEFDTYYLIGAYVPNSGDGLKRLGYRMGSISQQLHEKTNRNQCRDSLQSLVGPLEKLTGIKCRDSVQSLVGPLKSRTLKRCAQSVKRRAIKRRAQSIKRCAIKRRAQSIKRRTIKRCAIKRRAIKRCARHAAIHVIDRTRVGLFVMVFIN